MTKEIKPKTLAVACGGTGGHFYPGLTIAQEYKAAGGHVVLFIGGHHIDEQVAYARDNGLDAVPSPAVRLPRNPVQLALFPFRMLGCVLKTRSDLRQNGIGLALGMGSWASVPMGLATVTAGIPLTLHEGNASMGQGNRFLSRWAVLLGLSFPLRSGQTPKAKTTLVGMPIRDGIVQAGANPLSDDARLAAIKELGLDPDIPVVLIFGGSQGARAINHGVRDMLGLEEASSVQWQAIHLTGTDDNDSLTQAYKNAGITAIVKPRDPDIHIFYQIASGIICRSGASTVLELAIMGKAPLMIPFPGAKENHQMANALSIVEQDAGWLLPQNQLTPQTLLEKLKVILAADGTQSKNIAAFAHPDAAKDMALELFKV